MPLPACSPSGKIVAQTLFLGASVASVTLNKGWSGQSSQLIVNLIEDESVCGNNNNQFSNSTSPYTHVFGNEDNHYHTCVGPSCYNIDTENDEYVTKGKVYYSFVNQGPPGGPGSRKQAGIKSGYWYGADPGFFGVKNQITSMGTHSPTALNEAYDIIGTPVYFKMGALTFGGIVQSWEKTLNSGGKGYSVIIDGMEKLLSECEIILDNFAGSIYFNRNNTPWGGPTNYFNPLNANQHAGSLYNGNIPNIFNVYGFLESLNKGYFGGANKNDDGIRVNDIVAALSVLTSSSVTADSTTLTVLSKNAFSPFGRIITKSIQSQNTYTRLPVSFAHMGIIPPQENALNNTNGTHCEFVLDLSDLPTFPNDYRIKEPTIKIMDFISIITREAGCDFHISLQPKYDRENDKWINVIKLHVISRRAQPVPNEITNTVNHLLCNGYAVSNVSHGKEKNDTSSKKILIGGPQQRLYQAKSLRLSYSQSSYILNPQTFKFIDYLAYTQGLPRGYRTPQEAITPINKYTHGKIKIPRFTYTRNTQLSTQINPLYSGWYNENELFDTADLLPTILDNIWNDNSQLISGTVDRTVGNYELSTNVTNSISGEPLRFFPIYLDVICPFFGYVLDSKFQISENAENNEFKRIRPVYYDTWTGQLVIVLRVHELPLTNLDLTGFYSSRAITSFTLTENEIRAALAGFNEFLVYILSKKYQNDLLAMLRLAYYNKYYREYIAIGKTAAVAARLARARSDWSWRLFSANIAGAVNQPGPPIADIGQGEVNLEPDVMQDLKIIWEFVQRIGNTYYGKQYMVSAPYVRAYKDEQYADIKLNLSGNDVFVFQGGGKLYYNYEPTNDGAWEEYGNWIDDTIMVGSNDWYNLTDDEGKIKPLVGYNANNVVDIHRYNLCLISNVIFQNLLDTAKNNEFWNYQAFDYISSLRTTNCDRNKFVYEGLNLSSLSSDSYISVEISGSTPKDAFQDPVPGRCKKVYIPDVKVNENFSFLEPVSLSGPKIIVESQQPIMLNSISDDITTDPNRTVLATVATEDLAIYLRSGNLSPFVVQTLCSYIARTYTFNNTVSFAGSDESNANKSANFVSISEKAAHPFFIGIPIKHNQFCYGPWTSYADMYRGTIFPNGVDISLVSNSNPLTCQRVPITIDESIARLGIENMIGATVEVNTDLVPWKYGGMGFLDIVAFDQCEKDINFQSVLEKAQIDMPGMPIFDIGMAFSSGNINSSNGILNLTAIDYTDEKDVGLPITLQNLPDIVDVIPSGLLSHMTTISTPLAYRIYAISGMSSYTSGPIVSSIQLAIGQQGLVTTYQFRTYTPKIGLFNKITQDRIVQNFKQGIARNKTLARLSQDLKNGIEVQNRALLQTKLETQEFNAKTFKSALFGWSPGTVLVAQASPYIPPLRTANEYFSRYGETSLYSIPKAIINNNTTPGSQSFVPPSSGIRDVGISGVNDELRDPVSRISLANTLRYRTSVGLYETKELEAQLKENYGLQSVMSLDGIFSPISFYPTFRNSSFHLGLYNTNMCPFCKKTKGIPTEFATYTTSTYTISKKNIFCDKCGRLNDNRIDTLSSTATTTAGTQSIETLPPYIISSGTDISILQNFKLLATSTSLSSSSTNTSSSASAGGAGVSIPINMATLNPVVVPYGNLSNTNVQNYTTHHPDSVHNDISKLNGYAEANPGRTFIDRCRHSIQIVGRGSVRPKSLDIHSNLNQSLINEHNSDFYNTDLLLSNNLENNTIYPNNQRFIGLKGPLVMHAWGYDLEGYPVPNAADEPYEVDSYNQPRRFKLIMKNGYPKTIKFKNLSYNDLFKVGTAPLATDSEYVKKNNYIIDTIGNKVTSDSFFTANGGTLTTDIDVTVYAYEDDLSDFGGFYTDTNSDISYDRTSGFQGSIISKTQQWTNNKWSEKKKLKEFYLNWAERPDLWPVGPIDLRWDAARRVWSIKSSDAATIYKMVYVTLEEDLVKDDDVDDTYPARGFLDDLEYSTEPLGAGLRRLVFIKDRSGYTAPRGAKLLCRYDKDTGFYEPVSKSSFIAKGVISPGTNNASIEMSYAPGKKKGEPYPTMMVSFDNPFDLPITENKGLFTFLNGKWILTTSK